MNKNGNEVPPTGSMVRISMGESGNLMTYEGLMRNIGNNKASLERTLNGYNNANMGCI